MGYKCCRGSGKRSNDHKEESESETDYAEYEKRIKELENQYKEKSEKLSPGDKEKLDREVKYQEN
jgi:hypothetical protein